MPGRLKKHICLLGAVSCFLILPALAQDVQDGAAAATKIACETGRFVIGGSVDPVTGGTVPAVSEAIVLDGTNVTVPGCPSQAVHVLVTRNATWLAGFLSSCAGTVGMTGFFATIPSPACGTMTGWVTTKSRPLTKPTKRTFTANVMSIPPTVALGLASEAIGPADKPVATWTVGGDLPAGAQLELQIRMPGSAGEPLPPAQSAHPGLAPPGGAASYLRSDGSWSDTEVAYGAAANGGASMTLPAATEGAWIVAAVLTDATGTNVLAANARTLLVTSRPAIFLHRNRPLANPDDPVTITLQTAGASAPVRILAWLELPDGTQRGLPGWGLNDFLFYEGMAQTSKTILLDRELVEFGTGDYRAEVRMFDQASGALLASADAGFEVCETATQVSGVVSDASGLPLDGSTGLSMINALDLDDAAVTATSPVDAGGHYGLTLSPGRYLLQGTVKDAAGIKHAVTAARVVTAGCDGAAQSVDLAETSPAAMAAPAPMSTAWTEANTNGMVTRDGLRPIPSVDADGLPKPRVIVSSIENDPTDPQNREMIRVFGDFVSKLRELVPEVDFITVEEMKQPFATLVQQQGIGADAPDGFDRACQFGCIRSDDFVLVLAQINAPAGNVKTLTATVTDQIQPLMNPVSHTFPSSYALTEGDVVVLATSLAGGPPGLFAQIRARQPRPIAPQVTVAVVPGTVTIGGSVTATATLKDFDGSVQPTKTLSVTAIRKDDSSQILHDEGVTAGNGTWSVALPSLGPAGQIEVTATYSGSKTPKSSTPAYYNIIDPAGDLSLKSTAAAIRSGQSAEVCVTVRQSGAPQAGATVGLTVNSGSLGTGSIVTGTDGTGCTTFTGGDANGEARVIATELVPLRGPAPGSPPGTEALTTLQSSLDIVVDGGVALYVTADDTENGQISEVHTEVRIGDQPAVNQQVFLSLTGLGTLAPSTGLTADDGLFHTNFLAPPPTAGAGSTTVTAKVFVDGDLYTATAVVHYTPLNVCSAPNGASYCITPLPVINDMRGLSLNNKGQVVYIDSYSGYLWDAGVVTPLVVNTVGYHFAAINDAGAIAIGLGGGEPHGYLWKDGAVTDLGSFQPTSINNSGKMCGVHYFGPLPQDSFYQDVSVVTWDSGAETTLWSHLDLTPDWVYCAVNDAGDAIVQFGNYGVTFFNHITYYPTFWRDGGLTNLAAALPSPISRVWPLALNKSGTVIGEYFTPTNGFWSWQPGSGATILGDWSWSTPWLLPEGLNDAGDIVGACEGGQFPGYGCIQKNGTLTVLQPKIDQTSGYLIGFAWRINNQGQIVADCHMDGTSWDIHTRCLLTPSGVQVPVP